MNDKVKEAIKTVAILVAITVVCVALLAILNDVLYVAPDMTAFDTALQSKDGYTMIEQDVAMSKGTISVVAEAHLDSGEQVLGLYVQGKGSSPAKPFTLVVIVNKDNGEVLGVHKLVDGGDVGFEYNNDNLDTVVGVVIDSTTTFDSDNFVVQAGASYSTKACRNCLQVVAEYYNNYYLQGGQEQ